MSENKKSWIGRLFGLIWKIVAGIFRLFMLLGMVLLISMVWAALHGGPPVKIDNNVALVVAPTGTLVEQIDRDPAAGFFEQLSDEPPPQTLVRDVTDAL